jgi:hypothetical protein
MGPDVSQVKDVDLLLLPSLLGLLLRHYLNLHGPRWEAVISARSVMSDMDITYSPFSIDS